MKANRPLPDRTLTSATTDPPGHLVSVCEVLRAEEVRQRPARGALMAAFLRHVAVLCCERPILLRRR